ncbi:unnamed protein product, partial [Ectocarpus sp. 12 AP-2014]
GFDQLVGGGRARSRKGGEAVDMDVDSDVSSCDESNIDNSPPRGAAHGQQRSATRKRKVSRVLGPSNAASSSNAAAASAAARKRGRKAEGGNGSGRGGSKAT